MFSLSINLAFADKRISTSTPQDTLSSPTFNLTTSALSKNKVFTYNDTFSINSSPTLHKPKSYIDIYIQNGYATNLSNYHYNVLITQQNNQNKYVFNVTDYHYEKMMAYKKHSLIIKTFKLANIMLLLLAAKQALE